MLGMLGEDVRIRMLLLKAAPVVLSLTVCYYLYLSYYACGFNRYPGPFLAKFGKLWHWLDVQSNRHQLHLIELHRKYGDVVRIGPTSLSISNPDYVPKVYGVSAGHRKSDMYDIFIPRVNGKPLESLLSTRDPRIHAELHKPMAKEFSVAVVSEYEPLVDKSLQKWVECLEQRFCSPSTEICDMANWVRLYATEAIMDVTFSESMGFLDAGGDVGDFLGALNKNTDQNGGLCPMPWTAYVAKNNPLITLFKKNSTMFSTWAAKRIALRMAARNEGKSIAHKDTNGREMRDFLDRFLDASPTKEPPGYNFPLVMNWCLVNIMAGGDTTAIGLGAIVYYLLKNPEKQSKLENELRSSNFDRPISWKDCQTLPYLDGCIREGWRLHPSIGLGLERECAGMEMFDGFVLPGGAKVGMNAWVVNRQPQVFGDEVDDFVPERWLQQEHESNDAYQARFNRMQRCNLNFGSGSRACTGRYVAFMETYKAIATLFREFDIRLVDPTEEWYTVPRWTTRLDNIRCRIEKISM